MKVWERIKSGMDESFDSAIAAVHNLTEKAGESIELTRLRRQKARLELQLTRQLAELGNAVYEKLSKERNEALVEQLGISKNMQSLAEQEAAMVEIDRRLSKAEGAQQTKQ